MDRSARLMRRFFALIILLSIMASLPTHAQKGNKPRFKSSKRENLGERDNSFGGGRRKFKISSLFRKKGSGRKQKKTSHYTSHKKAGRDGFYKKKYTGKKGLFGSKKSHSWGGKAFKKNGKEDKRLFKSSKGRGKYKKKK